MIQIQPQFLKGWRREPDARKASHPKFSLIRDKMKALAGASYPSTSYDLRQFAPARHDQGSSNCCVANAMTRAAEVKRIQDLYQALVASGVAPATALPQALAGHQPLSRLAVYYLARELMVPQETNVDDGTYVSLAADALTRFGVARETQLPNTPNDQAFWPFDIGPTPPTLVFTPPTWLCMQDAYLHKISAWYSIDSTGDQRVSDVILALSNNCCVVYGADIDQQWMSYGASSPPLGVMTGPAIGSHSTVLEGWDATNQVILGENSWGTGWGVGGPDGTSGFYQITTDKIASDECSDFVVIQAGWEPWAPSTT